ncbi:MAG: sugar transferase [Actinobacteria bacterium]|nr:sugar transferase [Actinomycetota bacterium]
MAQPAATIDQPPAQQRQPLQRRSAKRIALRVMADAMAVSSALFLSSFIYFELLGRVPAARFDLGSVVITSFAYALLTGIATPVHILLFYLYGLYEPRQVLGPINEFKQVFHGVIAGTVLIFLADSFFRLNLARGWVLLTAVSGLVVVGGERLFVRKMLHFLRRRGGDMTRMIVLGTNHEARTVARTLERETWLGYRIVGFVDDRSDVGEEIMKGCPVLGSTSDIGDLVHEHSATLVLVAASAFDATRLNRIIWELQDADVDLQITSGTIDLMASRMVVQSVAGVPLLYVRRSGMDKSQRTVKRSLDIVGAALGILLLSPFLAAFSLWIRKDSPGPTIFKQLRVGQDGERFACWKFRTMVQDAEQRRGELEQLSEGPGLLFKLKKDPRITHTGHFLRRFSLDELPQLWNVLRGEMSLVGPRPALPSEAEQYDDWIRNRLNVKPGMTGLWQVSGRTDTTFADYVRYDLFYIQNWSLSLDLWILWRTFRAVATAEGAH